MKSLKFTIHAVIVAAIAFSSAAAQDNSFRSKARSAFADAIKQYKIPGMVVAVTRNGEHAFYTTGVASRSGRRPVTPDTLFELGSISKIFNVTLAALAEQRGQLSLNDKPHIISVPMPAPSGTASR